MSEDHRMAFPGEDQLEEEEEESTSGHDESLLEGGTKSSISVEMVDPHQLLGGDNRGGANRISSEAGDTAAAAAAAAANSKQGAPPPQSDYHSLSLAYQTYLKDDHAEQSHWEAVCRAYRQYAIFSLSQWANQQYRLHALPEAQRRVLPKALRRDTEEFQERASAFKEAAIRNQFCLDCILRHAGMPHSQQRRLQQSSEEDEEGETVVSDVQISKVSSVLKSLARDWSKEGKAERDMAYMPILRQIQTYLPLDGNSKPRICVPGAGVGRLALELSALGYGVQGNDFSLFMLLASDFMLNGGIATPDHPLKISPWLLESRNVHGPLDPLRTVQIPDVDAVQLLSHRPNGLSPDAKPDFTMAAGEFISIYNHPRERCQWDAVVCSFFLDTSPSIIEYIQIIYKMLKPGGLLISFGPLLYHWSGPAMRPDDNNVEEYEQRYSYLDQRYLRSVDLCWEDVREVLLNVGFELEEERTGSRAFYTADLRSMMNLSYRCVSFVARKKEWTYDMPLDQPAPPAAAAIAARGASSSTAETNVRPRAVEPHKTAPGH